MTPAAPLIHRPPDQRLREHRYRFGQAVVFGIPVVALHLFGRSLGGPVVEAVRWTGIFQALLAGWVVYVGATGMVFEGLVLLLARRRVVTGDLLAAIAAAALYVWSVVQLLAVLFAPHGSTPPSPPHATFAFHWAVILIAAWAGLQWFRLTRRNCATP